MTEAETEGLRRELTAQCVTRHTGIEQRLDSIDGRLRLDTENLYAKVNRIGEQQASLMAHVENIHSDVAALRQGQERILERDDQRRQASNGERTGRLVSLLVLVAGWAFALLMFALKELR